MSSEVTYSSVMDYNIEEINETAFIWTTNILSSSAEINQYRNIQRVLQRIMLVAIVIGNVTLLVALWLKSRDGKFSRMEFLIRNLAVSDLLVGFLVVATELIEIHVGSFYGGDFACKTLEYFEMVVTLSSTYMIVALSLDRLDAIARPMNFADRDIRIKLLTGIAWGMSLLLAVPMLILCHVEPNKGHPGVFACRIILTKTGWKIFFSLVAAAVFVLPAIIITTCCCIIVRIISKKPQPVTGEALDNSHSLLTPDKPNHRRENKSNKHATVTVQARCDVRGTTKHSVIPSNVSQRSKIYSRAKMRSIQMTFLIVLAFVACWCPYFVLNLLDVYEVMNHTPAVYLIVSLAPLNSCVNPLIYGLFTAKVCQKVTTNIKEHRTQKQQMKLLSCKPVPCKQERQTLSAARKQLLSETSTLLMQTSTHQETETTDVDVVNNQEESELHKLS